MISQEIINQAIIEHGETFPPQLTQVITTVPWQEKIEEITSANGLTLEQTAKVQLETLFVLTFLEEPADFPENIAVEAGISPDTAAVIAESISANILLPIKNSLNQQLESIEPDRTPAEPKQHPSSK